MDEQKEKATIMCDCGRTEHQKNANYCGSCGKKLEKATTDGASSK